MTNKTDSDEGIGIKFCQIRNEVREKHPQLDIAQRSEVAAIRLWHSRDREIEEAEKKAYDKWTPLCHKCNMPVDIPVCRNCFKDARQQKREKQASWGGTMKIYIVWQCEAQESDMNLFVGAATTITSAEKIRKNALGKLLDIHKNRSVFGDEPTISWFDIEEIKDGKLNDIWKEGVEDL